MTFASSRNSKSANSSIVEMNPWKGIARQEGPWPVIAPFSTPQYLLLPSQPASVLPSKSMRKPFSPAHAT